MTPEQQIKLAVLSEAVERADILAATQARLIESLQTLNTLQAEKIQELQSRLNEALCALRG